MRYFFNISYNGSSYHGWQKQKNALSIQEVIEKSLSTVFQKEIEIVGSGRTDTGVHAREQYFHSDIPNEFKPDQLKNRLNSFLPNDIAVQSILPVNEDAHARFDAIMRSYEYLLISQKNPFLEDFAYRFQRDLSVSEMNSASKFLIGKHDFQCFSRVKTDVKNYECDISKARWIKVRDSDILKFEIASNRFLRGMVRAVVGTLLDIGQGKKQKEDIIRIIESKDRKAAGRAVPAKGLYLTKVVYPKSVFI